MSMQGEGSEPNISNPLARQLNITVSVPSQIKIKLVDENVLKNFEMNVYLAGVFLQFATGFWVGYIGNIEPKTDKILFYVSIAFSLFFILFLILSIARRQELKKTSKEIEMPSGQIQTPRE